MGLFTFFEYNMSANKNAIFTNHLLDGILWNSMTSTSFVFTEVAHTIRYGGGFLYNLVFTEWVHCVSQNEVWGTGCYITLFSPSDVTAFHRMRYGEGGVIYPCFHRVTSLRFTKWSMGEGCYITLFSKSYVTAFHRMKYGGGGVI